MKKLHLGSLWRYLVTGVVISACLLLSSTVSLGDISSPTVVYSQQADCRLSPNPDDCYRKAGQQKWTPYDPTSALPALNTQTLGLEGPFSAELKYDADLSWILGLKYLHMFNESAGIATKITGGLNELRGNVTAGYALSKDHQIKLTYEYLTQNLPFDFASGSINEWVAQHSLGAAYQYVIRHEIVHSLELSGYATRASSKELDSVAFNQQVINPGTDYLYDVNFRRIAGGSENTVLASVNLFPFANDKTTLTLGGGYSNVSYDTIYESNQAASRPAFKAEITHLLSSKAKLTASTVGTAASTEHSIGVSHLLPNKFEASVKGQYTAGQGTLSSSKSITLGLTYPAADSYSLSSFGDVQELKNWIDKPIVYSSRVLAIKDEMVQRFEFKSANTIPDQFKFFEEKLDPVLTSFAFSFTNPNMQITYTVTTIKVAVGEGETASSKDFTKDLNLALVSNGPNQATLQSAAGIPAKDLDGHDTTGTYSITLTANGVASGMPITLTNGFKLTVGGNHPPTWDGLPIPDAYMGHVYPFTPSPPSSVAEVDLTAKVTVHAPDTSFKIEIQDKPGCPHPVWLGTAACTGDPTHTCLTSGTTVVPNVVNDPTFCVQPVAIGIPSGDAAPIAFTPAIHQTPPVWHLPAVAPARQFDTFPSQPIPLEPYIDATTKMGLAFQKGADFDNVHWTLDETTGDLALKEPADITYVGLQQVPVVATNETSFAGTLQMVPVNVVNSNFDVTWVHDQLAPNALAADTYNVDLNSLATALAETKNGLTPVSDKYDFTIVGSPTQGTWTVNTDAKGIKGLLQGTGLSVGTVEIEFKAFSHAAGKNAIGGNVSAEVQKVTLNVVPNPNLSVAWTGVNKLPDVKAGEAASIDLSAITPRALVETTNGSSTTPIPDTYAFNRVSGTAGWSIDPDNKTLKNDLPVVGPVTVILTAESTQASTEATGGTGGSTTYEQAITFNVIPNSTLSVDWTGVKTISNIPAGEPYGLDLNSLEGSAALAKTTHGSTSVPDIYTFAKVSSTDPNWTIAADGKTLTNPLPAVGTSKIVLTAASTQASPLKAKGGTGGATTFEQEITITVGQNPALDVKWTAVKTLTPGTAGQAYSLDLDAFHSSGTRLVTTENSFSTPVPDTYTFTKISSTGTDPNWSIAADGKTLTNPSPVLGVVDVVLTAESAQASTEAKGGTGGGSTYEQLVSITIAPNPALTVDWTDVHTLSIGKAGVPYHVDLDTFRNPADKPLVQTKDNGAPVSDTHSFVKVSSTDPNFVIDPDGKTLRNNAPVAGTFDIVLTAKSTGITAGTDAKGGDVTDLEQKISVTIETNPDLAVTWVNNAGVSPPLPQTGISQKAYALDLNALTGANALIKTTTTVLPPQPVADTYTFTLVSSTGTGWSIPDGKTLTNATPEVGTFEMILTATSTQASGASAEGGNVTAQEEKIFVTVKENPQLKVEWTGKKTLPNAAQSQVPYSQDLQALQSVPANALVKTLNGATPVPVDTYKFKVVETGSDSGWFIDADGKTLKNNAPVVKAVGTTTVILRATSKQADTDATGGTGGASAFEQAITITVNPNPALTAKWVDPSPPLVNGISQVAYNVNLDALQGVKALVKTTKGAASVPEPVADNYTFVIQGGTAPGWTIAADGKTLTNPTPEVGTFNIFLTATSLQSSNLAIGGNVSTNVEKITVTIKENPALTVQWTGKKLLPTAGVVGAAYAQDLEALQSVPANALVKTLNGVTPVPTDTYKFTVVKIGSDPNWVMDTDNKTLRNNSPVFGTAKVILRATSTQAGTDATGGTGGASTYEQLINITIGPNPSLVPAWVAGATALPSAAAGGTYIENMNALSTAVALVTTPTDPADKYDFEFVGSPTRGTWTLTDDGTGRISKLTGSNVTAGADIEIQFKAKSRDAGGKYAVGGNVPGQPQVQKLTIKVNNVPKFKPNPTGEIKFDTTGNGDELGAVTDGIPLNGSSDPAKNLIQPNTFTNLSFIFDTDKIDADNWVIKDLAPVPPSTQRRYFLVRKLTEGTPNTVSADGVTRAGPPNVPIHRIKACTTDYGAPVCGFSGHGDGSDFPPIKAWVKPDPNIVYKYADTQGATITLVAATSDGKGNPNPVISQDIPTLAATKPVMICTVKPASPTAPCTTKVLGDQSVSYVKPTSSQGYIDYTKLGTSIAFKAPTPNEYATLVGTPDEKYLWAKSVANGNVAKENVWNLRPITAGELILVPSQREDVNQPFSIFQGNLGPNVGVGINALTVPCVPTGNHQTITAFAFHLDPVIGKKYYLTQMNGQWTSASGGREVGICKRTNGPLLPVNAEYYSGGGTTSCGGSASSSKGTWDATGIVGNAAPQPPRCVGGGIPEVLPAVIPAGGIDISGNQGVGGYFTLYVTGNKMNRGLRSTWQGGPDFPTAYPGMTSRLPLDQHTAPMMGTDFSAGLNGYPRVTMK